MKYNTDKEAGIAKIVSDRRIMVAISALIGVAWFFLIYGFSVVNVTNDAWILGADSDITQHYLGWRYYRMSNWHLMFGLIDGITSPYPLSIIYMDSIPLFAVVFKILSPLLPDTFQYFGMYGLISFMLQSVFAALVMEKITDNKECSVIFGFITITFPAIYQRMFDHTALAGHWIIWLAIYLWCIKEDEPDRRKECIRWSICMSLAVFLHPYYIPMVAVMMICSMLENITCKTWYIDLIDMVVPIISALFCMFLLGAFYGGAGVMDEGLGNYSMNLNGFYNSYGMGKFMKKLPWYGEGQAEGFAYLGMGCLIAVVIAAILRIINYRKPVKKRSKFIILYMVLMVILALSPVITFNADPILIIDYSEPVMKLLSIFRASGRFGWPVAYLIMVAAFAVIVKFIRKKYAIVVIAVLCIVQITDIYGYMDMRAEEVTERNAADVLKSHEWQKLADGHNKVIFITYGGEYESQMLDKYIGIDKLFSIMEYAADNGMYMNDGYVSRRDIKAINESKEEYWQELINGNGDKEAIYIFYDIPYEALDNIYLYYIDEVLVGTMDKMDEIAEFDMKEGINLLHTGTFMRECYEDAEGVRYIRENGESFGPYYTLEPGTYKIVVTGNNLKQLKYDVSAENGTKLIDLTVTHYDDTRLEYTFTLESMTTKVETRFRNEYREVASVNAARLYKIK